MGFFLGGAVVSTAPTAQKCTIYLLVQQRLLHPLEVHQPCRNAPFTLLEVCQNSLLQLLALMRFEPVLAPTRVSHERHVQRIGVLHLFDNNLFDTLLLLRQDGEVEFVVHLQNHL